MPLAQSLCGCSVPGISMHQRPMPFTPPEPPVSTHDFELVCGFDPLADRQIFTRYDVSLDPPVIVGRFDAISGEEWEGDPLTLEECGAQFASYAVQLCDSGTGGPSGGTAFMRHYVTRDGEPTGAVFDTELITGAPYVVTAEINVGSAPCTPQVD